MLAARAGAIGLVETLLVRGADPEISDDYGQTAWMGALNRAIDDPDFARAHIAALFERLGPETLDVHTDGRLVRLERGQGEFWPLGLMLAGLKTHCGGLAVRPLGAYRYTHGFFAEGLRETLDCLPEHLWPKTRRKKEYLNSVLARAEIGSAYRPARKLSKRREVGYYMPAPDMKLRRRTAEGEVWVPTADALSLAAARDGGAGRLFDVYALPPADAPTPPPQHEDESRHPDKHETARPRAPISPRRWLPAPEPACCGATPADVTGGSLPLGFGRLGADPFGGASSAADRLFDRLRLRRCWRGGRRLGFGRGDDSAPLPLVHLCCWRPDGMFIGLGRRLGAFWRRNFDAGRCDLGRHRRRSLGLRRGARLRGRDSGLRVADRLPCTAL